MIEQAVLNYLSEQWEQDAEETIAEMEATLESWRPEQWDVFNKPTQVQLLEVRGY